MYWVGDRKRERLRVVVSGDLATSPQLLSGANDLGVIAKFVSEQFAGPLPFDVEVNNLATFFKDIAVDPLALVATREELDSQRRAGLDDWLQCREKSRAVFESLWTGIRIEKMDKRWTMKFNVFKFKGGVDSAEASGTLAPLTLQELGVEVLKAAGEFCFPIEG